MRGLGRPPRRKREDMERSAIDLMDYQHIPWVKEFLAQLYPGSQPSAASGTLELLADLFPLTHLRPKLAKAGLWSTACASTDGSGNTYVLNKHYTNRWPGAALLMEMATILLDTEAHMMVTHTPRERNVWADDLANLNFAGFDPEKRWDPILEPGRTNILHDLLQNGMQPGTHLSKEEQATLHSHRRAQLTPRSLAATLKAEYLIKKEKQEHTNTHRRN